VSEAQGIQAQNLSWNRACSCWDRGRLARIGCGGFVLRGSTTA
jgi:hypothetical protein